MPVYKEIFPCINSAKIRELLMSTSQLDLNLGHHTDAWLILMDVGTIGWT